MRRIHLVVIYAKHLLFFSGNGSPNCFNWIEIFGLIYFFLQNWKKKKKYEIFINKDRYRAGLAPRVYKISVEFGHAHPAKASWTISYCIYTANLGLQSITSSSIRSLGVSRLFHTNQTKTTFQFSNLEIFIASQTTL